MNLNSILIPVTTQAVSIAIRPPSSLPSVSSNFGAKLASSISNHKPQLSDAKTNAGNGTTVIAKSDANIESNSGASVTPRHDSALNDKLATSNLESGATFDKKPDSQLGAKSAAKFSEKLGVQAEQTSDAKSTIEIAPNAVITPAASNLLGAAMPISNPIFAATVVSGATLTSSIPAAVFDFADLANSAEELHGTSQQAVANLVSPSGQSSSLMPTSTWIMQSQFVQFAPAPTATILVPKTQTPDASSGSSASPSSAIAATSTVVLRSSSSDDFTPLISSTSVAPTGVDSTVKPTSADATIAALPSAKLGVDTASTGGSIVSRLPSNNVPPTSSNADSSSNALAPVATPIPGANSGANSETMNTAHVNAASVTAPTAAIGITDAATANVATTATTVDKKPLIAVQSNVGSPQDLSLHGAFVAIAPANDPSATLTASGPPAPAPTAATSSDPAAALPQTHQMLDSVLPDTPAPAGAPIAPGSAAELQMNAQVNAQMHLDIHTDAFGAVEIHTVVQQSQVGITVHANGDIARWFNSEVPGLESGLNKSHLNLTTVDFDNGRSGVHTASGFQQGQPRQNFSQRQETAHSAPPGEAAAPISTAVDMLPSELSNGQLITRVSIHA